MIPILSLAGSLSLAASASSAYQSATVPEQLSGSAINLFCSVKLQERLRRAIIRHVRDAGVTPHGFETADVSYLIRVLRLDSDRWKDLAQQIELRLKQGEERCTASH